MAHQSALPIALHINQLSSLRVDIPERLVKAFVIHTGIKLALLFKRKEDTVALYCDKSTKFTRMKWSDWINHTWLTDQTKLKVNCTCVWTHPPSLHSGLTIVAPSTTTHSPARVTNLGKKASVDVTNTFLGCLYQFLTKWLTLSQ